MYLGPMNVGHGTTPEITCPSRTSGVRGLSRHLGYFRDVHMRSFRNSLVISVAAYSIVGTSHFHQPLLMVPQWTSVKPCSRNAMP